MARGTARFIEVMEEQGYWESVGWVAEDEVLEPPSPTTSN